MKTVLTLLIALLVPALAFGQNPTPVTSASTAAFSPSPDHAAVDAFGTALVTRYDLETVAMNALGVIVFTQQLGKPTPVSNEIRVPISSTVSALTGGTIYQSRVAAVGPGGVGRSALSNPFGIPSPRVPAATGTPTIQ